MSAHVVVIGAGVIGLSAAWKLSTLGAAVTLVDEQPGKGATWAAAGMLAPNSEATFGEESLLELSLAAIARWPSFVEELHHDGPLDLGYATNGTLNIAFDQGDRAALERLTQFRLGLGLAVEPLTGNQTRDLEPYLSPSVRGGVLAPDDLSIDSRRYWSALLKSAAAQGVRMIRSHACSVEVRHERVRGVILTNGERIACDHVVIAAGCFSGQILGIPEQDRPAVRPVKGQILRLDSGPVGPASQEFLQRTVRALVHGKDIYIVPRNNGEIVIGATVEEKGFDTTISTQAVRELLRDACEAIPILDELTFKEVRAGLRPGTPDNSPIVGLTSTQGLIMATGHYRNGILLSPITADAIADLVMGKATPRVWDAFRPDRFNQGAA